MSEEYIPDECPLCDRVGTVVFKKSTHRAVCRGERVGWAYYEHHGCYCIDCGESFVPSEMMAGNLRRMREAFEAFEKMEVIKCPKN